MTNSQLKWINRGSIAFVIGGVFLANRVNGILLSIGCILAIIAMIWSNITLINRERQYKEAHKCPQCKGTGVIDD